MINRKLVSNFNWWFFITILLLSAVGVVIINSANHGRPEPFFRDLYIKQVYWILCGLVAMLLALIIDYRKLSQYAYVIYGVTVLALVYVLINGVVASGAKRWIYIGSTTIQVSEFAKIALILALAKFFESGKMQGQYTLKDLWIPGGTPHNALILVSSQGLPKTPRANPVQPGTRPSGRWIPFDTIENCHWIWRLFR